MSTDTTIAPIAHTFNPAAWLEQFTHVGGGYTITEAGVYIGWINPAQTDASNRAAKNMVCALSPDQHKAIEAHLIGQQAIALIDPITSAWEQIKQARATYNSTSPDDKEAERAHWSIVDLAEALIQRSAATSLRGVEVKLWTALAHCTNYTQDDIDAHSENLAALIEREETFDFAARILIGAIRDLRMIGEA